MAFGQEIFALNMKHFVNCTMTTDLQKNVKVGPYIGEKQKYYICSWNSAWTFNDSYQWDLCTTNLVCKTGRWTDCQSHLDYYNSHCILIFMPEVWNRNWTEIYELNNFLFFALVLFVYSFWLPVYCMPISCLLFFIFVNGPWYLFHSRILLRHWICHSSQQNLSKVFIK